MTCLPAGSADDVPATARNNILFWYPMVGVAIGFILILGEWLAAPLPDFLQAALLVTLWGDYHRRSSFGWAGGLRRCLGGRTGQSGKNLKIMEDPRCGTMAVIAVTLTLILKTAALAAFHNWVMLLLTPTLAKIMILPAFLWLPYAKEYGLGGEIQLILADQKRTFAMLIVAVGLLSPLLFAGLWQWLLLTAATAVTFVLWRFAMKSRLQGFTGNCIGLLVELSELVLLLVFVTYELAT